MKYLFSLLLLLSCGWLTARCQTITLRGGVLDKQTGEPLQGATIEIEGKEPTGVKNKIHLMAGLDGTFLLRNVRPGDYKIKVNAVGYDKYEAEITLQDGGKPIRIDLERHQTELMTVQISGGRDRGSEKASIMADRRADIVQNSLSARAIEISPDLSVANSAQRVSGVSIERSSNGEGQYVIVRGMEKRYIYTLVNGVKIPSPDNKNRYVPLDIFPADMLDRLEVTKSLTPNMEGDAIGGAVNMVMKDAPSKFTVNATAAAGMAQRLWSEDYMKFNNGPGLSHSPRMTNGPDYLATMNDFPYNAFSHSVSRHPIGEVLGLSLGGRLFGDKLGVMVAGSYQNTYRNISSIIFQQPDQLIDGGLQLASVQRRNISARQERSGAHLRLDYHLNAHNNISFYGMYVNLMRQEFRNSSDTNLELARTGPGLGRIENSYRDLHETQQISNYTLKGQHVLGSAFFVDWTAAYSKATLNKPDEATLKVNAGVQLDPVTKDTVKEPANLEQSSREFTRSTDEDKSGYLNFLYKSNIANARVEWSVGGMYRDKHRTSNYDSYTLDPGSQIYDGDISKNTFTVSNPQGSPQSPLNYTANEKVGAFYGMLKVEAGAWLITGGARYEHTTLDWISNVSDEVAGRTGKISYYDVLPSGNIKYSPDRKQSLRLSYYSAISRPNFYEVIPYTLYNPVTGQTERGNPYLKRTTADNLDLRYEYYPKGLDQLLLGVFYKRLRNPIEYSITNAPDPQSATGNSNMTYYVPANFGNATNYGAELDITKFWRWLGIRANYTYTNSSITTTKEHDYRIPGGTTAEYIEQKRPLQGQSKHIANFSLLFKDDHRLGLNAQLAFGYTSRRINTVSQYYNYDIWQKDFGQLDFSVEKRVAHRWYVYAKVNNLLNTPLELEVRQPYAVGTTDNYPPQQMVGKNIFMGKDTYGINYLLGVKFKL